MITAFYAAPLALLFVRLSLRTIHARRSTGISIGDGGQADLTRAMRVQANFAEYTPIALLMIVLAELQGLPGLLVHALGITLLAARLVHAYGVSREPEDFRFRIIGMQLTVWTIILGSLAAFGMAVVTALDL